METYRKGSLSGWGVRLKLRVMVVRSSLNDAGVHAWTTKFWGGKGKKGRGKRTSFRYGFGRMGIR